MRLLKIFLYLSLLTAVFLLTACVPSEPAATGMPPTAVSVQQPTQQPTPTLQTAVTSSPSLTAAPVNEPPSAATQASEPMPAATMPSTSDAAPADWPGLLAWLTTHWRNEATAVSPVINALDQAGWIDASSQQIGGVVNDFVLVDLNGDTVPEWVVTLHPPDAAPLSTPRGERPSGNLVIIGAEGVIFQAYSDPSQAERLAPLYLGTADFTGDGIREVVIETLTCGANTCTGKYNIMSYHFGYLSDIATANMQDKANPTTSIAVEVNEPVTTFYLDYFDGDDLTGLWRRAEWAWQNETFEMIHLDVIDDRVPTNLTELETWLTGFYADSNARQTSAQQWLFAGGWASEAMYVMAVDMDGNGENEWIVPYHLPDTAVQENPGYRSVRPGGMWIVNSSGIVYKSAANLQKVPVTLRDANSYLLDDLTGDGRFDLIIESLTCDPGACAATYELVSGHTGAISNLLSADHELRAATRLNPTAVIVEPGNLDISYQTMDGHVGHDNWVWDAAAGTLRRLTPDEGRDHSICSITVSEGVNTYMRPHVDAAVFSTVGYTEEPEVRTADGWLGFDPGIAQAGNVGIFRMRWVPESQTAVTGDCAALPVVVGPQPTVCYAMIFIDTPVYEMPDVETAVVANLSFEDYAPAIARMGDAWLQIDIGGTPAWLPFNAAGLSSSCEALPDVGSE
ncbi:MAG: hypothetical protein H6664_03470 [Ardenticatenaceae bacterium]|nr:hypothetical protein [Ardenticatenaceae bacterium]MCB9003405.1 hypothetical protein [Ardenticatenaceae bacterium]